MPNKAVYTIEIEQCSKCPNSKSERDYTADSFEYCEKYFCSRLNRFVHRYVGTFEKTPIPNDCPLLKTS